MIDIGRPVQSDEVQALDLLIDTMTKEETETLDLIGQWDAARHELAGTTSQARALGENINVRLHTATIEELSWANLYKSYVQQARLHPCPGGFR